MVKIYVHTITTNLHLSRTPVLEGGVSYFVGHRDAICTVSLLVKLLMELLNLT